MTINQKIDKLGSLASYLVSIVVLLVFGVFALHEAFSMDVSQQNQRYYLFLVGGWGLFVMAVFSLVGNFLLLLLEKFSPKFREKLRGES